MKEEIKNLENIVEFTIEKRWKRLVSAVKKNTANENSSVRKTKQNKLTLSPDCAPCGMKNQSSSKI